MNRQLLFLSNPLGGTRNISPANKNMNIVQNPFSNIINFNENAYKIPEFIGQNTYSKNSIISFLKHINNNDDIENAYNKFITFIRDKPKPSDELDNLFFQNKFEEYFNFINSMLERYITSIDYIKSKNDEYNTKYNEIITQINNNLSDHSTHIEGFKEFLLINNFVFNDSNAKEILEIYLNLLNNKNKNIEKQNDKINNLIIKLQTIKSSFKYDDFKTFIDTNVISSPSSWTF